MVGRMFREAVENLIDDVKESIEEQGRSSGQSRRMQPPRPPVHHLDLPPNLEIRSRSAEPPSASPSATAVPVTAAPASVSPAPQRAPTPIERVERSEPEDVDITDAEVADEVTSDHVASDHVASGGLEAEEPTLPAPSERAESVVARLEADCDAARQLYRESRAELREARRVARLAARDERRDRRYERRSRSDVTDAP